MNGRKFLCLGAGDGWHATQLHQAAASLACELQFATYESIRAVIRSKTADVPCTAGCNLECEAGSFNDFDAILTRTMPAGSLEQVTFRLATLHSLEQPGSTTLPIVNPPRSLEIAIDKFATLAHVAKLGYSVPDTIVAQSKREAIDAFHQLGGDCIVKPIFGGEGRGVMRVQDAELAWYTFWTLENLGAVCYVQRFVAPGGVDTRLLVIGDAVIGVRRRNHREFRTNISSGAQCEAIELTDHQIAMATRICKSIGLKFASVDLLDCEHGEPKVIEVNAIPGWKGAQRVSKFNIAEQIVRLLHEQVSTCVEARC